MWQFCNGYLVQDFLLLSDFRTVTYKVNQFINTMFKWRSAAELKFVARHVYLPWS